MQKHKRNKIIIVSVIAVILLLAGIGTYLLVDKNTSQTRMLVVSGYYNAAGEKISGTKQSIVGGVTGVSYIDLTATLTNTGDIPLTCNIVSASPTAADTAFVKTQKSLPVSGKAAWTSDKISVAPFESETTPTTFTIVARCSYVSGSQTITLPDKSATLSISIKSEGTAGFVIGIDDGGEAASTEYCGDSICQITETTSSCPNDCAVSSYVKFRTSDLSYVSGSAIAYTQSCGNALTAYGYSSAPVVSTPTNCAGLSATTTLLAHSLPGSTGKSTGSGNITLWATSSSDTVYLCEDPASGTSTSFFVKIYKSTDSDASKVDTSLTSFDSAKEVSC